jgi:hypothetical protein
MFTPLSKQFTISNFLQRGLNLYELILTNWGNTGGSQDDDSQLFPNVKPFDLFPSLNGICIAPFSTVDVCTVQYSITKDAFVANAEGVVETLVSTEAPLIAPIPSPIKIALAYDGYLPKGAPVAPYGFDAWGDTYIKQGATTPSNFGALSTTVFEQPCLRLLLFPNSPPVPPLRRAPMVRTKILTYVDDGNEQLVAVFPISGRRRLRVGLRPVISLGGAVQNVRITGLNYMPGTFNVDEFQLGPASGTTALDPTSGQSISYNVQDPMAQFLLVYAMRAATTGTPNLQIFLRAED